MLNGTTKIVTNDIRKGVNLRECNMMRLLVNVDVRMDKEQSPLRHWLSPYLELCVNYTRSEERRVGKEWRCGWGREHYNKKRRRVWTRWAGSCEPRDVGSEVSEWMNK